MQIVSYGEDAYMLWALTKQLDKILTSAGDSSEENKCNVIYRPSFGRAGGENSAQFGEFDFILLSETSIYLGESKWDSSSEKKGKSLKLREEQLLRHQLFTLYLNNWFNKDFNSWEEFLDYFGEIVTVPLGSRKVAPEGSRLSYNLFSLLQYIKSHFNGEKPTFVNMLLYLYQGNNHLDIPTDLDEHFKLVSIDYSVGFCGVGNYIEF